MKIIKTKKYAQLKKDLSSLKNVVQSYIDFLDTRPFKENEWLNDQIKTFFEVLLDGLRVEELFYDKLTEKGIGRMDRDIAQYLQNIQPLPEGAEEDKVNFIREVFNLYYDNSHPVKNNFFYMDAIPEVNEWLDKNSKARNYGRR